MKTLRNTLAIISLLAFATWIMVRRPASPSDELAPVTYTAFVTHATCMSCDKGDEAASTLYDRLGGIKSISAFVDQFIANVVSDNVINARFAATVATPSRARLLRLNLIDQICEASGGPCRYKGLTMKEAHKNMNITQAEFDALVGDLVAALDQFDVPEKEKNELLAILGPMQTDIVGR